MEKIGRLHPEWAVFYSESHWEAFQQLLDELLRNFVQTFTVPREWILLTLVTPTILLMPSSGQISINPRVEFDSMCQSVIEKNTESRVALAGQASA